MTHIRLSSPLPCGIAKIGNPQDICGRSAYVADVEPHTDFPPLFPHGRYLIRPICEKCTREMAAVYGIGLAPPVTQWLPISAVRELAAEMEPDKYPNFGRGASQRWRHVVANEGWEAKGLAMQDSGGRWLLLRTAVVDWIEERRGRNVRK